MGDNRAKEIDAARYYYNSIISSFEEVLLEYEAEQKFEDCAVILEVINDLKKELRLIEIVEHTGRGVIR